MKNIILLEGQNMFPKDGSNNPVEIRKGLPSIKSTIEVSNLPSPVKQYLIQALQEIINGEDANYALRLSVRGTGKSSNKDESRHLKAAIKAAEIHYIDGVPTPDCFRIVAKEIGMSFSSVRDAYYARKNQLEKTFEELSK